MRKTLRFFGILPFLAILLGSSVAEAALLERVYVSEVDGKDVPPCGPVNKPCKTFAFSVTIVAPNGRIIALSTGEYGPVTIPMSLTIEAAPGVDAMIQASYIAIQISAASSDVVVLRGLTLKGIGSSNSTGISASTVGSLHVENCVISRFSNAGIRFNPPGGRLFVRDTIARNNGFGIWVVSSPVPGKPKVSIDHCKLDDNGNGFFAEQGMVTIRNSSASGNDAIGFGAVGPGALGDVRDVNIESCVASNNGVGVSSSGGAPGQPTFIRVSNSTVAGNALGLSFGFGAELLSRKNNTVEGNTIDGVFSGTYLPK
jgi:hypothetical protein